MSPVLLLLIFVAGVLVVLGIGSIYADMYRSDRARIGRRIDDELRERQRKQIKRTDLFKFKDTKERLREAADGELPLTLRERYCRIVDYSGLNIAPSQLLLIMGGVGLTIGALLGWWRQNAFLGVLGGLFAGTVPFLYVFRKWHVRQEKMIHQLPDAFDLMARIIRAGQTMWQAIQAVTDEFEQPLSGEFSYCYEQQNLGIAPEVALRDLARRTGILEVKIFVLAMLVQQQSGGNLAQVLDNMSHVLRERFHMRSKIRALTAEGRMQAMIVLILPLALVFGMMVVSERYAETIVRYPNIIAAMLVSELFGVLWIRRIVNFDF